VNGVNKCILIGRLGKDPEVRRLNSGDQVVSFSLATSEAWRDKASGERKERTEWHNIVCFNESLGKIAEQYCKKGMLVYLEGQIQTRKWKSQSGEDKYSTEIVLPRFRGELQMLSGKGEGGAGSSDGDESQPAPRTGFGRQEVTSGRMPAGGASSYMPGGGPIEDDIPFSPPLA
jgi:single-strand DNA-binding protein